jgi:argininosuccinate lyase
MPGNQHISSHTNENYNLWGGRFQVGNDKLMKMFNESLPVDKRLWREDIIVNSISKPTINELSKLIKKLNSGE